MLFLHSGNHSLTFLLSTHFIRKIGTCLRDSNNRASKAHDIALLRITLDLNDANSEWLNESVLPSSSFGVSGECTIYGYGYKDVNTMKTSDVLSSGEVIIISLDECTQKLGPFVAPQPDSGMMCAIGYGVDACQGDSGSPLICEGLIQGISSYGMSCGVSNLPGIYTSIGAHLDFIQNAIQTQNQIKTNASANIE